MSLLLLAWCKSIALRERWVSFAKVKGKHLIKLIASKAKLFSVAFLTFNTRTELKLKKNKPTTKPPKQKNHLCFVIHSTSVTVLLPAGIHVDFY